MGKRLLNITLLAILAFGCPANASSRGNIEVVSINDIQSVSITMKGQMLHVSGADGQTLQIYNVAGMCVKSIKLEGQEVKIELNLPKGCYIAKVGNIVRKIYVSL
jgi:hypothetical protein